jgi:hypothetical protein
MLQTVWLTGVPKCHNDGSSELTLHGWTAPHHARW